MADPTEEKTAQAASPSATKSKKKGRDDASQAAPAQPRVVAPVPPKHSAKPAVGADLGGDAFLETAGTAVDALRENWQVIAAAILVLIVAVVFITFRIESGKVRERAAWDQYRDLDEKGDASAEEWLAKAVEWRGTSVEPFLDLRAADRLCASGSKDDLAKAHGIYDSVEKSFAGNPVTLFLAKKGLAATDDAVGFDPSKAAAGAPAIEKASDLSPLPTATATPAASSAAVAPTK